MQQVAFRRGMSICLVLVSLPCFARHLKVSYERDISYGESPWCKLDLKFPQGLTNFSTVVWFHGGGLTGGSRSFIRIDDSIAQVAADYRLLGKDGLVDGKVCIDDAAAAVSWTLENIGRYGGDTGRIFVSGMSAGGYLTMMVGMDSRYLKARGHDISELAGMAPVSGQATKHFNVRKFAGDKDPQYLPKIDELAPLAYCSKSIPPIVAICGEAPWEWKCRSEENRLLIASCVALGHEKAWFVSCPFADHGRAYTAGVPYVEMFVKGRLPEMLRVK